MLCRACLDALCAGADDSFMKKLILLLVFACTACSGGTQNKSHAELLGAGRTASGQQGSQEGAKADSSGTLARIRAMVGNAACTEDAQCHTLPLGAKACGGPESYLPWSSAQVKEAELRALGEAYKEERRAANTASGMMSTCQFMVDPGAMCKAGTCQLGGGDPLAR